MNSFSVAFKISNHTGRAISKIVPDIISYNKQGEVLKHSTGGMAPELFRPLPGLTVPDKYVGVIEAFYEDDIANVSDFGWLDVSILELTFASLNAVDQPIFEGEWIEFEKYKGLKLRLSSPFIFIDDLSGENRFGIALELKNASGKQPKFLNIQIKVYDEHGIIYDEERQNHNQLFEPMIGFSQTGFPVNYQGVNRKFYTNEEGFINSFKKIEIVLNDIVY